MIPGVHTFFSMEVNPFPVHIPKTFCLSFHNYLPPFKVLRLDSCLKDNYLPPLVREPTSLLAMLLTATRAHQFAQLRSSLE